jgi:hypothetical protein
VAIDFPQLWVRWIPSAVKAWPLFSSRSKGAPLSLTWQPQLPRSARDALTDTDTPKRIRQLDFSGHPEQLEHFLGALNSSSISVTSSIRLRSTQSIDPGEYLTRFLSLSFPKLSNLDIENFLPDSSSPIFTTSNLSSLKLRSPYDILPHYTLAQLSQVLQTLRSSRAGFRNRRCTSDRISGCSSSLPPPTVGQPPIVRHRNGYRGAYRSCSHVVSSPRRHHPLFIFSWTNCSSPGQCRGEGCCGVLWVSGIGFPPQGQLPHHFIR